MTALLHDFDWEIHPTLEEHPQKGEAILAERGVDEEIRRAILSHANHTGVPRDIAAAKRRSTPATSWPASSPRSPTSSRTAASSKWTRPSVKKKMKDKAFARSVNRQDIVEGAQELGVPLEEHIDFCVKAMQARADELGLKGSLDAGA